MDHASLRNAHTAITRNTFQTQNACNAHFSPDQINIKMDAEPTDAHTTRSTPEKVTAKSAHHMRFHLTGPTPRESLRSTRDWHTEPPTTRKLTEVRKEETSSSTSSGRKCQLTTQPTSLTLNCGMILPRPTKRSWLLLMSFKRTSVSRRFAHLIEFSLLMDIVMYAQKACSQLTTTSTAEVRRKPMLKSSLLSKVLPLEPEED